jgi:hypothetical protein
MEVKLYINSHKTNTVSSSDLLYKPVGLLWYSRDRDRPTYERTRRNTVLSEYM